MSISNSVTYELSRLRQETEEKARLKRKHEENIELMKNTVKDVLNEIEGTEISTEIVEDGAKVTWNLTFEFWNVSFSSEEVLKQYSKADRFRRSYKDIIEALIIDRLSKLHP